MADHFDLLNAILNQNISEADDILTRVLNQRLRAKLDEGRKQIAATIFNDQHNNDILDEHSFDDDEIDQQVENMLDEDDLSEYNTSSLEDEIEWEKQKGWIQKHEDPAGNGDDVFNASNLKQTERGGKTAGKNKTVKSSHGYNDDQSQTEYDFGQSMTSKDRKSVVKYQIKQGRNK